MKPMDSMTLLKHVEGDHFRTVRDNDLEGHDVYFIRDDSGNVTRVKIHSMSVPRL